MLAMFLLAATIAAPEVRLAPDQPLPYVFADEPVIIEFRGEKNAAFDAKLTYQAEGFDRYSHGIGPITLKMGRPYWTTTDLEPVRFGPHAITMELKWPTGAETLDFTLLRLRRPNLVNRPGVITRIPSTEGPWDILRRIIPARYVSIGSDHPQLSKLLDTFAREDVAIRLLLRSDPAILPDCPAVVSVAISATHLPEEWMHRSQQVRERYPSAKTVLDSPMPEALAALFLAGGAALVNGITTESIDEYLVLRSVAEERGYEGLEFTLHVPAGEEPAGVAQTWNAGLEYAEIDLDAVTDGGSITDALGAVNAMMHIYDRTRPAGRYVGESGSTTVLRDLDPDRYGHWIAPARTGLQLPASQYGDRHGNVSEEAEEAAYAFGNDPDFVLSVIAYEVRQEASAIAAMPRAADVLPEDAWRAIEALSSCDGTTSMRSQFFVLLRALPALEEAWHAGQLRRSDAAATIAAIERLVLRLGALEQEMLVPFVEPIEETLDRCAEQQAVFLTAPLAPGASAERGEWLMMHLSDLVTRARRIHDEGRIIEADAIAALAEWRSRALIHAARARPLSEPEPEIRNESAILGIER